MTARHATTSVVRRERPRAALRASVAPCERLPATLMVSLARGERPLSTLPTSVPHGERPRATLGQASHEVSDRGRGLRPAFGAVRGRGRRHERASAEVAALSRGFYAQMRRQLPPPTESARLVVAAHLRAAA